MAFESARRQREPELGRPKDRSEKEPELGRSHALDSGVRSRMSGVLGHELGAVRLHTGPEADAFARAQSAHAVTVGGDIAFASGEYRPNTIFGDALLAHELAHTIEQQRTGGGAPLDAGRAEAQSDKAALSVLGFAGAPSFAGGGLALRRCSSDAGKTRDVLDSGRALSADEARRAFNVYRGLSASERDEFFTRYRASGGVLRVMDALPAEDAATTYRAEVQDVLRRVQEAATRSAAGMDDAAMATEQATMMRRQAEADAAAARAAAGLAPAAPTAADLQTARQTAVEATTPVRPFTAPQTWYEALPTDEERKAWDARAMMAILRVCTLPDAASLNLTFLDFEWDPNGVARRGSNVLGMGRVVGDRRKVVIGREWLIAAEINPAYGLSIAVHESRGHLEYETSFNTYAMSIYNQARVQLPGAEANPSDAERMQFGYPEAEMYSLLRSLPFHTPLAPADAASVPSYVEPAEEVRGYVRRMQTDWAPTVWPALLRGFYTRLRYDPRINPEAFRAFRDAITAEVPEPNRSMILAPT